MGFGEIYHPGLEKKNTLEEKAMYEEMEHGLSCQLHNYLKILKIQ